MKISNRIASSRPLATTAMHGRVEAMRAEGVEVIDFSIAISHLPAPAPVLEAAASAIERERTMPYTGVAGAPAVRAVLRDKLRRENAIDAAADEIIVTNGAKQALYEALYALTDPGDAVIVFRPYWPAYLATAQLLGLRTILVDLPERVTPELLDALAPAKLVIINNPHNPTGKVYTRQELEHIAAWIDRTGMQAIVDESYEHLIFEGAHTSLAALCDWSRIGVVTIFSASQCYAMMGWRVGFALAPAPLVDAMRTLQGPITAAAPHLSQVAASAAFACGAPLAMMADYRERRALALALLAKAGWLNMASPASGPYLWGDVRALTDDTVAFAEALLESRKVALMPGEALGVPGYIRLGYISDDVATLGEGIARLVAFGESYSGPGG
jgi:aspartate aminotransferase